MTKQTQLRWSYQAKHENVAIRISEADLSVVDTI